MTSGAGITNGIVWHLYNAIVFKNKHSAEVVSGSHGSISERPQ